MVHTLRIAGNVLRRTDSNAGDAEDAECKVPALFLAIYTSYDTVPQLLGVFAFFPHSALLFLTLGGLLMRCLVTGAAGFVGSSLCDQLLADGHTVIGIDCFVDYYPREMKESNLSRARQSKAFTLIEGDLLTADLKSLLEGVDWIFHQAAQAGVRASWGSYFESYTKNNILATQRLLEQIRNGSPVKKVVYASSSSIYGNAESHPTPESATPRPISPYGVTKLAAEHLMVLYATEFGVPTTSLRYFTVFGPRQRPDMAFHRFIRGALTGEELTLYGDGTQSRDFTYISDIVQANIQAAERAPSGSVYNIGGGTQATINDVLAMIEEFTGPFIIKRFDRQSGDAKHTGAETTRARAEIGFSPLVSLREGIGREVSWLRELLGR